MNRLKPREKALLVITVVAMVAFIAWRMGLESIFDSFGEGNSDVSAKEKEFEHNLKALGDMKEIESAWRRIGELPNSGEENLKAPLAFTQQVSQMCRELGFEFPPIRPEVEEIEGVTDYELINVAVKTEGTFEDTINLMKKFRENGLIFRDVDLQSTRDREIITARITVARIAEKDKPKSRARLSRRSG